MPSFVQNIKKSAFVGGRLFFSKILNFSINIRALISSRLCFVGSSAGNSRWKFFCCLEPRRLKIQLSSILSLFLMFEILKRIQIVTLVILTLAWKSEQPEITNAAKIRRIITEDKRFLLIICAYCG